MENRALNARQIKIIELTQWKPIDIDKLTEIFNVSEKTIDRDIAEINEYLKDNGYSGEYILKRKNRTLGLSFGEEYASINYLTLLLNMSELHFIMNSVVKKLNGEERKQYVKFLTKIYKQLNSETKERILKNSQLNNEIVAQLRNNSSLYTPENEYRNTEDRWRNIMLDAFKARYVLKMKINTNGYEEIIRAKVTGFDNEGYLIKERYGLTRTILPSEIIEILDTKPSW